MAPEQIERPLEVDQRADIYSLGVVFYEMLTGELPVGRFPPPSKKVRVDVRLDEVVLRALEREPERRYQSMKEVKTEVESIALDKAPARKVISRRAALIVGGIVLIVALIAAAWGVMTARFAARMRIASESLTFNDGVPALSRELIETLDLRPMEVNALNRILQETYREYLAEESKHMRRSRDEQGHLHISISPFSGEVRDMERRFWSRVGEILEGRRLSVARRHLPVRQILPYGDRTVEIEMWREGLMYHVRETSRGALGSSGSTSLTSSSLPTDYERFWSKAESDSSEG